MPNGTAEGICHLGMDMLSLIIGPASLKNREAGPGEKIEKNES